MKSKNAVLLMQDGTIIRGDGFGHPGKVSGELVFNTSMTGYQEALTDPSYSGQFLMMTNPLIGNYGINKTDFESRKIHASGFVVDRLSSDFFHRDAEKNVDQFLKEQGIPGICNIDTRDIVLRIRDKGVMPCTLFFSEEEIDESELSVDFDYSGINFVKRCSTREPKIIGNGAKKVVLIDFGAKAGIIDNLVERGIRVIIVPWDADENLIRSYEPDGILLSNGPGDPSSLKSAHKTVASLSDLPIFGICLGHQILAHANGGKTFKMKFGHRGSNHPVIDLKSKKAMITTQNHGFAVEKESLPGNLRLTHENLNDKTVEGMESKDGRIFSVQFHPEARPGPHDANCLFDRFLKVINE
jgi:carbamoyl-phosphate synthase small subunit